MIKQSPVVPYGTGLAYERDGKWYVLVTIDNASQVERPATEDEIPGYRVGDPRTANSPAFRKEEIQARPDRFDAERLAPDPPHVPETPFEKDQSLHLKKKGK